MQDKRVPWWAPFLFQQPLKEHQCQKQQVVVSSSS